MTDRTKDISPKDISLDRGEEDLCQRGCGDESFGLSREDAQQSG